ncbi:hypothetical protein GQX73_g5967 [Xylaria multiplex]|uniref:Uncharacterized protein n=1 Tax=Xylaria multiplex TaxID=323545 RepID=A0A7C8IVQ9_9PEZI|nr:hypothetical protein GQX73_g5967 [Xylaria multiplex]
MSNSMEKQSKGNKNGVKKAPQKGRKQLNSTQKRGQPASAARLVSSPYIKFGWHKPLNGEVKEAIQGVASIADSMYMLQIERERPIESLSLNNGLFWEHRQLKNKMMVSTPAIDHLGLFSEEDDMFQETLRKIAKFDYSPDGFRLHYLFSSLRSREFLVLPIQINTSWVTLIARFQQKEKAITGAQHFDMEITDIAVIDPIPPQEAREKLILTRLRLVLAEGCIDWPADVNHRKIAVPEAESDWQTGLISYAISREFLRRLKVLQFRQKHDGSVCREFLWAPFEEHYNFDAYRQSLMSACAHQCIEGSAYQVRLALEVPSEDSNYHREKLCCFKGERNYLANDEKWDIFERNTHLDILVADSTKPRLGSSLDYSCASPKFGPTSPVSPTFSPTSPSSPFHPAHDPQSAQDPQPSQSFNPPSPSFSRRTLPTCSIPSPKASPRELATSNCQKTTERAAENFQPGESSVLQATTSSYSKEMDLDNEVDAILQLDLASEPLIPISKPESDAPRLSLKRPFPGDDDEGAPSPTRVKIEDESS